MPLAAQGDFVAALDEAERYQGLGRYADAIRAYQRALPLAETDDFRARVWFGLGGVYQQQRQWLAAADAYRQVTRLPQAAQHFRLSAWQQVAAAATVARRPELAREAYERLVADFPEDPEAQVQAIYALADLDRRAGKPGEAMQRLRLALAQLPPNPRTPLLWEQLLRLQVQTHDLEGATVSARAALEQFPRHTQIMTLLIEALRDANHLGPARDLVMEMLNADPGNPACFDQALELHQQLGDLSPLQRWAQHKALQEPNQARWLLYQAHLHMAGEKPAQALPLYDRILALRTEEEAQVLRLAVEAARQARDLARAEQWLRRLHQVEPGDTDALLQLGDILRQQGQGAQALDLWKQALRYDPADRQTVVNLGRRLHGAGLYTEALALYNEARQQTGVEQAFSYEVGQAQEALQDYPAAVRSYVQALQQAAKYQAEAPSRALLELIQEGDTRPTARATLQALGPPEDLPAEAQTALVYARVLDGEEATAALARLTTTRPTPTQLGLWARLAYQLQAGGQTAAAIGVYAHLLTMLGNPAQKTTLAVYVADLQQDEGDWMGALDTLASVPAEQVPPALVSAARIRQAELLLHNSHQPEAAQPLLEEVQRLRPESRDAWRARWGLAEVAFARGEYETALKAYAVLLEAGSPEPDASREMPPLTFGAFYLPGREGEAEEGPGEDYVAFQGAEALLRQGQLREAQQAFQAFAGAYAASALANDALERLLLLQALSTQATAASEYLAGLRAYARGDTTEALRQLEKLAGPPLAEWAALLRAEVLLAARRRLEAVTVLRQLVEDYPDSPQAPEALLRASQLLTTEPEARREVLRLLRTKYPDSPEATAVSGPR